MDSQGDPANQIQDMNDSFQSARSFPELDGSVRLESSGAVPVSDTAVLGETNEDLIADIRGSLQYAKMDSMAQNSSESKKRFVSPKDFDLLKVIGMGAFGKVIQVRSKSSRTTLAMKVISKRLLKRKEGYVENVQAERNILTRVRHPFVVNMHCSFQTSEKLFIIMDFLAGGELFLRLGREGIFMEKTAAFYLAEIILALDHLHGLGVLHRDLKPENILLGVDGHVCLTDFGLAKDLEEEDRALTICGTQEYMAPEMVAGQGYGKAADYWSLGCIAYEMLRGRPPFERQRGEGHKDLFRKIMKEKVKMPTGSTAAACKLLKGLLNRNVQARLGAARSSMFEVGGVAALKQAEFFADIKWDKLEHKDVEPPELFAVQTDEDLSHFHEEFTNMPLPRSVVAMAQPHYKPRRVESHAFRGFSYVQKDFPLPDRDASEVESYWNSADEDAESVSECASSKIGDDDALILEATPVKKKRPPRKRKKKNALKAVTSASGATTPALSVAASPAQSAATSRAASPTPTEPNEIVTTPVLDEEALVKKLQATAVSASPPKAATPPTKAVVKTQAEWQATSAKKSKAKPKGQAATAQKVPVSKKPAVPPATATRNVVGGAGWKSASANKTVNNTMKIAVGTTQQHQRSAPPVSDWRQHTSPNLQPRRVVQPVAMPNSDWRQHSRPRLSPKVKAGQQLESAGPAWPSLEPPALKKEVKPAKLQGAWGTRNK